MPSGRVTGANSYSQLIFEPLCNEHHRIYRSVKGFTVNYLYLDRPRTEGAHMGTKALLKSYRGYFGASISCSGSSKVTGSHQKLI